jgi:undecaprenyl diphosphate synthase
MKKNVPAHVGIILDGNGRWARRRGLPRLAGHRKGAEKVKEVVIAADKLGIKILSLFVFSTENWKRPPEEVDGIFKILDEFLEKNSEEFKSKNLKLRIAGDLSPLNNSLRERLEKLVKDTENNTGLIINMAINYGGQSEILRAVNLILNEKRDKITKEEFEQYLYSKDLPPLDFVIRTSGEKRVSNFMLYQMAYAEFHFPKIHWPSFNERRLKKEIKVFSKRTRRFGKV